VIGIGFAQQHQTIELRKRIGSEEKRIDCAEDGRVCADAEGKGQNCSQRETWGADQPPQAVTQVLATWMPGLRLQALAPFRESCVALGTAEIEIADDLFVEQFWRRNSRTPKSNNIKKQVSFCRKHPRAECPLIEPSVRSRTE